MQGRTTSSSSRKHTFDQTNREDDARVLPEPARRQEGSRGRAGILQRVRPRPAQELGDLLRAKRVPLPPSSPRSKHCGLINSLVRVGLVGARWSPLWLFSWLPPSPGTFITIPLKQQHPSHLLYLSSSLQQPTTSHHRRRTTAYRPLSLKASEIETWRSNVGRRGTTSIFILVDIVDWNVTHG
jgi:hypothetical protein